METKISCMDDVSFRSIYVRGESTWSRFQKLRNIRPTASETQNYLYADGDFRFNSQDICINAAWFDIHNTYLQGCCLQTITMIDYT